MAICFVVMPFEPELHYMYLFMKQHIESKYAGTSCQRGDTKILTVPVMEKILVYIKQADVVIADCTGGNPNVFYELGMAHALRKHAVLITADEIMEVPTDILPFEFIRYRLDDEKGFFDKLDNALDQVLGNQFEAVYKRVSGLFEKFRTDTHRNLSPATKDEFTSAALAITRTSGMPRLDDQKAVATLFLPLMVKGPTDLDVVLAMNRWIKQKFNQKPLSKAAPASRKNRGRQLRRNTNSQ